MDYVKAEVGEIPKGSDKSTRIYYDENMNQMIRSEGSRSWRNNNPGNLRNYSFSRENGSIGTDGKLRFFLILKQVNELVKNCLKDQNITILL